MGLVFLVLLYLLFCSFFALFAAAFLNKIFRQVLRFRADWTSIFIASLLTCVVTGVVFCGAGVAFDDSDLETPKVLGATFVIAFVTATAGFRLIIKSESGRSLSWLMATVVAFSLSVPPLALISLVSMLAADY